MSVLAGYHEGGAALSIQDGYGSRGGEGSDELDERVADGVVEGCGAVMVLEREIDKERERESER